MIKKKKFKSKQKINKQLFLATELRSLVRKSLQKNFFINSKKRLSYLKLKYETKFKTHQKLICLFLLSKRVPNRSLNYSRFFLTKNLNYLNIGNILK